MGEDYRRPLVFPGSHAADFDAILNAPEPFALARFGDGEVELLRGRAYRSGDAWSTSGPSWLRPHLQAALDYVAPGYCVGLPAPCCLAAYAVIASGGAAAGVAGLVCPTPRERTTFATIFLHGNLRRAGELAMRYRGACLVGPWAGADVVVPADAVTRKEEVYIDCLVANLLLEDRPILLAAGPLANVLVHRYHAAGGRQICLDVGSPLDVLRGQRTRHYHDPAGPLWSHACSWTGTPGVW